MMRPSQEETMSDSTRWRLSLMMFLEYVCWGSWLPLLALYLGTFLHFSGTQIGGIFFTQAIASVTAVVVSGQIADRYFSSEMAQSFPNHFYLLAATSGGANVWRGGGRVLPC